MKKNIRSNVQIAAIITFALLLPIFYLIRTNGQWAETDTSELTRYIGFMQKEASLAPAHNAYAQGYGYTAIALFFLQVTGLDVSSLQLLLVPFLFVWLLIPAWLLYRELLESDFGASLAVILLLIQPEFLFVVIRSSHEKFTRGIIFLCLFILVRSFKEYNQLKVLLKYIVVFYIALYSLISINGFIAISFIVSILIAFVILSVLHFMTKLELTIIKPMVNRLIYILIASLCIAFIFVFYIYQPAQANLMLLNSTFDRIAALLLDVESTTANPYTVVNFGWINLPVYFVLSISNWLLLGASALIWLSWLYRFLRKRKIEIQTNQLLLWSFYTAFAAIGAVSILADVSGAIGGNLQHRSFPSFVMLAVPLVVAWVQSAFEKKSASAIAIQRYGWAAIAVLIVLAILKSTNDPVFSNNWVFFTKSEVIAMRWIDTKSQYTTTWADFNERLTCAYRIVYGDTLNRNQFDAFSPHLKVTNFLVSDTIKLRAYRIQQPLPYKADSLITYDNGKVVIYRRRPVNPFQD